MEFEFLNTVLKSNLYYVVLYHIIQAIFVGAGGEKINQIQIMQNDSNKYDSWNYWEGEWFSEP